jgi:hypothetical protein
MASPVLVSEHLDCGRDLLKALDARGLPVTAAFWYLMPDWEEWRYAVATTRRGLDATPAGTRHFTEVFSQFPVPPVVGSLNAHVMGVREPLVSGLRAYQGTDGAPFVGGRWVNGKPVGEWYVEGIYLYRAERLVPDTGTMSVTFTVRDKAAKRWVPLPGLLMYAGGRLVGLGSTPGVARTRQRLHGLSARFYTLDGMFTKKGQAFGHLRRWEYSDGRLEGFREEVRPVPVAVATPTSP